MEGLTRAAVGWHERKEKKILWKKVKGLSHHSEVAKQSK